MKDPVTVFVESQTMTLDQHHSSDQFGSWGTNNQFYVECASLVESRDPHEKDVFRLPVKKNDEIYIVVMEYSEGDSFGTSRGNGEVIWAYSTMSKAQSLVELIKSNSDCYHFKFKDEFGQNVILTNPAYGFFEELEKCYVFTKIVH